MSCDNGSLQKAKAVKDDEFYTPYDVAVELIKPFEKWLVGKKIICPCDSEWSNIYKRLKSLGYDVTAKTQMCNNLFNELDYSQYDVVITNPPWSKTREFFQQIGNSKYLVICNWLLVSYKWFHPDYWSKSDSGGWTNTDKQVRYRFYTNIFNPPEWQAEKGEYVKDNIMYTISCFDYTSRRDFRTVEYDKKEFKRFAFGNGAVVDKNCYSINSKDKQHYIFIDREGGESNGTKQDRANRGQLL